MAETSPPTRHTDRAIFITHHVPDMESVSITQFERIIPELKKLGFTKHRFDIRWKTAMPSSHEINDSYIGKAALLAQAALRQGMEPIVILSTPPTWAYKGKSSEAIGTEFTKYAKHVRRHFDRVGVPITSVQLLNEVNNPIYTPPRLVKELPNLAAQTRAIFGADTDVSATIVLAKPFLKSEGFITKHKDSLSALNSIGLDFYPGSYQFNKKMISPKGTVTVARQSLEAIASHGMKNARPDFLQLLTDQITDTTKLRRLLDTTKRTLPNAAIDIGEFGFPTLDPLQRRNPKHEALQSYAIDKIVSAMTPVINEYGIRNIGFYELYDDKELGVLNWGLINDKGEAKKIVERLPMILKTLQLA